MKKILLLILTLILVIPGVFAVLILSSFWTDGFNDLGNSLIINDGEEAQFHIHIYGFDPYSVNIVLRDLAGNQVGNTILDISNQQGSLISDYTIDKTIYGGGGNYRVHILADDGYSPDSEILNLKVNNAPVLNAVGNRQTNEGQLLQFTVTAGDVDNDALTLTATNLPDDSSFTDNGDDTGVFTWQTDSSDAGIYSNIVFTVSDGVLEDSEEITITVNNVNRVPVITSTPVSEVNETNSYTYQVTATDADGDTLTYSLTQNPNWLSIDSSTGLITGTALPVDADTPYAVTVNVFDGVDSDTQTYTLTVFDVPVAQDTTPPVITLLGSSLVIVEVGTSYTDAGATALDDIDGNLTGYIVIDTSAVDTNILGSYIVTYDVTDAAGNPATQVRRNVDVVDTTAPIIIVTFPVDGANYNTHRTVIQIEEISDQNLDTCWYSVDGGQTNQTFNCNAEFINGITSVEGENIWIVYANDTAGNEASINITFNVDTLAPVISIIFPTDGTEYDDYVIQLQYSVSDQNLDACWYSVDGGLTNTSVTCGETIIGLGSDEGTNTWTIYARDTFGNTASASVSFSVNLPSEVEEEEEKKKKKEQEVINFFVEDEEEYLNQFKSQPLVIDLTEEAPFEEPSFFGKIWESIVDFFKSLFRF